MTNFRMFIIENEYSYTKFKEHSGFCRTLNPIGRI